ncbi:MAG: hypothetical protein AAB574_03250 [Patescibacteria group bacterium]
MTDIKNTLLTSQSTRPQVNRIPPKNPLFQMKNMRQNTPNFTTVFRTQNRGGK